MVGRGVDAAGDSVGVGVAVAATIGAGTARMRHENRLGSPASPLPASSSPLSGEGWIDLNRRRAWTSGVFRVTGRRVAVEDEHIENYWDGPTLYVRFGAGEPWRVMPLIDSDEMHAAWPAGAVPLGSPLWLLDALSGATEVGRVVGREPVGDVTTTHVCLGLNVEQALNRAPHGPLSYLKEVPVELWVDDHSRIRRMGHTFPPRWFASYGRKRAHWYTTELWDLGTSVDVPPPPAAT